MTEETRKKRQMTLAAVALLLVLLIPLAGCFRPNNDNTHAEIEGDPGKADLGVLYVQDEMDGAFIEWCDRSGEQVAQSRYNYENAIISYENIDVQEGKVYLAPEDDFDFEEKRVLIIDAKTGECENIVLPMGNHVGCDVEGNQMVVSSNGNGEGEIDIIDLTTKDVKTLKSTNLWDAGIMQVALVKGKLYGNGDDAAFSHGVVYEIDMGSGTPTPIYTCKQSNEVSVPSYLERHGSELAFLDGDKLIKYDTDTGKLTTMDLGGEGAEILFIRGDIAWICYTNPHDEETESRIEAIDYHTGKVIADASFDGGITQLEASDDTVYALGYDHIARYTFDGTALEEDGQKEYDSQYTLQGIFIPTR